MFPQSLILVANSQNPHSSVSIGRTTSGVPGGIGQFATSINKRVTRGNKALWGAKAWVMKEFSCHPFHLVGFQERRRKPVANLGILLVCTELKENDPFPFTQAMRKARTGSAAEG